MRYHCANLFCTVAIVLLLAMALPFPSLSKEPVNITHSNIPGEFWRIHYLPANGLERNYILKHSTDYGVTWEEVPLPNYRVFGDPTYHQALELLTIRCDDVGSNSMKLVGTRDQFETTETLRENLILGRTTYEWLPGSDGLSAFHYPTFSFDTLGTMHEASWQLRDPRYPYLTGGDDAVSLGWSPGDMLNRSFSYDDTIHFFFSQDTAETFEHRSQIVDPSYIAGTRRIQRGRSSGEVYYFNFHDRELLVSLDTMRTWTHCQYPIWGIYRYVYEEAIPGWSAGELYVLSYDFYCADSINALHRTTDYGATWETVYSSYSSGNVGETEMPSSGELAIWPNPGNGLFRITLPAGAEHISLFNMLGQRVKTRPFNVKAGGSGTLQLHDLPSGVYFLLVVNRDNQLVQKRFVLLK